MNGIPTIPPVFTRSAPSRCCNTVFVVDDFAPMCELVARHLSQSGYRVLTANDLAEARRVIRSDAGGTIDLLLTDLKMPGMRGDELADWCIRERPRIRVVFMSSTRERPSFPFAADYIEKPFSLAQLGRTVRDALADQGGSELELSQALLSAEHASCARPAALPMGIVA